MNLLTIFPLGEIVFKSTGLNDFSVTLFLIFLTKEYVGPDRAGEKPRLYSFYKDNHFVTISSKTS